MAQPMTNDDLAYARAQRRWSETLLTVSKPAVLFSAEVDQDFESSDDVVQVAYTNGSGDYSLVQRDLTLYVGTELGGCDVGIARIRKTATNALIYIGKTSDIAWERGLYLSVMAEVLPWAKQPILAGDTTIPDDGVDFIPLNYAPPVVKIGPYVKIIETSEETVDYVADASNSYSPLDLDLTYQWYAPGASATADMDTASPTLTYEPGEYLCWCVVTDANGAQGIRYQKVFINPNGTTVKWAPGAFGGDVDNGFSFEMTGFAGIGLDDLRERGMIVIWKRDYIGTQRVASRGPLAGYENLRFWGWIGDESLTWGVNVSSADFTVYGPTWWMMQIDGYPLMLKDVVGLSTNQNEFTELTLDIAIQRLIQCQSTFASMIDITLTGDTRRIPDAIINTGKIYEQIKNLGNEKLLALPGCDRFGNFCVEVPTSLLPHDQRSSVPTILDLLDADWREAIEFKKATVFQKSRIQISGIVWDGTTSTELASRAPGNTGKQFGTPEEQYTSLIFLDQAEANRISGDLLAGENNSFTDIDIPLAFDLDFVDIFPRQRVRKTISASDTPREISETNLSLTPLAIAWDQNPKSGAVQTTLTCEGETLGVNGSTYILPKDLIVDPPIETPLIPPNYPPTVPPLIPPIYPPTDPTPPAGTCMDVASGPYALHWSKTFIQGTDEILIARALYPCKIRANGVTHGTKIKISIRWGEDYSVAAQEDSKSAFHCYAIDAAGNRILTGSVTPGDNVYFPTVITFSPLSETDVAGFEIALDAGSGPGPFKYVCGDTIASGSVQANDEVGVTILDWDGDPSVQQWYAVENTGGPWWSGIAWNYGYNVLGPYVWETEALGTYYRSFIYPTKVTGDFPVRFRVGDYLFGDNTGSLGYLLKKATRYGSRAIRLGSGQLFNVCAPSG